MKTVQVAAILPFWRYAVGPTSGSSPAIPFYTLAGAEMLFDAAARELPWFGCTLYRRRWFRGIEVVQEYMPTS